MSIQNCPGFVYTVRRGDTMFRLARRYGITLDELIAANPQVADPNRLTIGQQLCIPAEPGTPEQPVFPAPPCPGGTLYTVRAGDTMFLIAQRNNISLQALIAANPQVTDPNVIFPGQRLCIPGGAPPMDGDLPEPPACVGGRIYTVQPGDTLYSIAQANNISLASLIAANPQIADPNVIFPGQKICIPGQVPVECEGGVIHVIRAGDTLFSLAAFYGTTVDAIIAANPGIDPNNLVIGQPICIPLPQPAQCTGQLYTVQSGETLSSIAIKFGVSLSALIAANPQIVDPNRIFPGQIICIPSEMPLECEGGVIHVIRAGDTLFSLAAFYGTTVDAIIAANPGIDPNNLVIGQLICIPLPQPAQCTGQLYTVQSGETLSSIARKFGVSLTALIAANPQIVDPNRIFPGQIICIPSEMPLECEGGTIHIIQAGDTLFSLARFYGTTVDAILAANPGLDPQNLMIGQPICIPLPRPVQCTGQLYTVQPGETLSSIARKFGVSLTALIAANPQIVDPNRIFPGQIICIPAGVPAIERCEFMMNREAGCPPGAQARVVMDFRRQTAEVTATGMPTPTFGRCYFAWFMTPHRAMRHTMMSHMHGTYKAMVGPVEDLSAVTKVLITSEPPTVQVPGTPRLFSAVVAEKCR